MAEDPSAASDKTELFCRKMMSEVIERELTRLNLIDAILLEFDNAIYWRGLVHSFEGSTIRGRLSRFNERFNPFAFKRRLFESG